jgi:hypothetical protein
MTTNNSGSTTINSVFFFILSSSIAAGEQPVLNSVSMRETVLVDFGWRYYTGVAATTDTMELL